MMAKRFPQDAKKIALSGFIPDARAATNATSDERGSSVAPRKADKKSANSLIKKLR
jgi:hypothetical protein